MNERQAPPHDSKAMAGSGHSLLAIHNHQTVTNKTSSQKQNIITKTAWPFPATNAQINPHHAQTNATNPQPTEAVDMWGGAKKNAGESQEKKQHIIKKNMKKICVTGSRKLTASSPAGQLLATLVKQLSGCPLIVGDCRGADAIAAASHPNPQIIIADQPASKWGLAARSIEVIHTTKKGNRHPLLIAAPLGRCPATINPSTNPSKCFNGSGSGSWSTIAYAAALRFEIFLILTPPATVPTWLNPTLLPSSQNVQLFFCQLSTQNFPEIFFDS